MCNCNPTEGQANAIISEILNFIFFPALNNLLTTFFSFVDDGENKKS